jgi:pimeloyl-ACP methyl ester carboxylesterase
MGKTGDGFTAKQVTLGAGTIHYREAGEGEPIVFVHGFGVNGRLWDGAAARLAGSHRCILPDWPLGAAPEAMRDDADLTAPGIARLISEFLAALGLEDVTLVGNDSGGAVCQVLVTEHPDRVGRLVLTNCDCFEKFPPGRFKTMARMLRLPLVPAISSHSMRLRRMRSSPLSFGALTADPIDDELLKEWVYPGIEDRGVRRDGVRFFTSADARITLRAAERLPELRMPALLVWGTADRFFTVDDARRLAALIPDSKLVEVPEARTFLPLDRPELLADEIAAFARAGAAAA